MKKGYNKGEPCVLRRMSREKGVRFENLTIVYLDYCGYLYTFVLNYYGLIRRIALH